MVKSHLPRFIFFCFIFLQVLCDCDIYGFHYPTCSSFGLVTERAQHLLHWMFFPETGLICSSYFEGNQLLKNRIVLSTLNRVKKERNLFLSVVSNTELTLAFTRQQSNVIRIMLSRCHYLDLYVDFAAKL